MQLPSEQEYLVLREVASTHEPVYAMQIANAAVQVPPDRVYRALKHLLRKRLIYVSGFRKKGRGPVRKLYRPTAAGSALFNTCEPFREFPGEMETAGSVDGGGNENG